MSPPHSGRSALALPAGDFFVAQQQHGPSLRATSGRRKQGSADGGRDVLYQLPSAPRGHEPALSENGGRNSRRCFEPKYRNQRYVPQMPFDSVGAGRQSGKEG